MPAILLRRNIVLLTLLSVGSAWIQVPALNEGILSADAGSNGVQSISQDVTRLECGRHVIFLDLRRTTPIGEKGDPTRIQVYRDGRQVWSLGGQTAITEVVCRGLTGDGIPGVVFTDFSFGAHCCTTIFVLSLRSPPRLLLQFFAGNAHSYEIRDLKGDGNLELILGDDSFAYFGGLPYAWSPAWLPLVACYQKGAFADCTRRFPDVVRLSVEFFRARLKDTELRIKSGEIEPSPEWPADFWIAGPVLGLYANSVLLGQDSEGWAAVLSKIRSKRVLKWFECNRPTVQRWARHRDEILHSSEPHELWKAPGCEEWEPGR